MRVAGVADAALIAVVDLSVSLQSLLELGDGGSGSFALRDGLDVESGGAGLALCVPVVCDRDISRARCCLGGILVDSILFCSDLCRARGNRWFGSRGVFCRELGVRVCLCARVQSRRVIGR